MQQQNLAALQHSVSKLDDDVTQTTRQTGFTLLLIGLCLCAGFPDILSHLTVCVCFQMALWPHMPEMPAPFCFHSAALRQHLWTSFSITFPCNCSVCLLGVQRRLWVNSCVCVTWKPFRTQVL